MEELLKKQDILLNVVVWADYQLRDDHDTVVLGVDYTGDSYLLEPEGQFSIGTAPIEITEVWYIMCVFSLEAWFIHVCVFCACV